MGSRYSNARNRVEPKASGESSRAGSCRRQARLDFVKTIIKLAYGKTGLDIDLPDDWNVTVIEPQFVPGLGDPLAALQRVLRADPIIALECNDQIKRKRESFSATSRVLHRII